MSDHLWCFGLAAAVAGLIASSASADNVLLDRGDQLTGVIVGESADTVVLEHDVLGRLSIPRDQIASIEVEESIVGLAALQDELTPVSAPEKEWKSHFQLGGSGTFGNSDTQTISAAVTALRERADERTALDAAYYFGTTDGDKDTSRFTSGILHDWLLPDSPWLYFASGRFDFDEFQSWDYRASGHGGVGYQLIDREDLEITLRAGLGAIKEWGSLNTDVRLEALLGFDTIWRIDDRQQFRIGSTVYPDLDDTGEFRARSYAGWSMRINDESNTSVVLDVKHEYQSIVDAGRDHSDWYITAGLQFDF
ncbi:MAG: DUF481 domain-containing protein [Phycisphaerales bacterium]|nr:DUF481 domain-containing protein [Phycisphaerae bacterium]NNF42512.1 DUF481 domain-containing protein [Phycisphaerales bacterium]NNM24551.1 DUF481 domain-containing protein [Phycisphaerales bacterium]